MLTLGMPIGSPCSADDTIDLPRCETSIQHRGSTETRQAARDMAMVRTQPDRSVWYGWLGSEPKVNSGRPPSRPHACRSGAGQTHASWGTRFREEIVVETRRTFDEQLHEVRAEVVKLAVKSCEQIGAATQALLDADLTVVDEIYDAHREIKERVLQIEHRVYQLLALQQPMASDLRTMLAVLRILH